MAEILFDLMICFKIETSDEIDTITNILNINPTDYILKVVSITSFSNNSFFTIDLLQL